jgi:ribosomal protein S18 acetylase RimI-like enzyme
LSQAGDAVRSGDALDLIRRPLYSESSGIGLRKTLSTEPDRRLAKVSRVIRPATTTDLESLVDEEGADTAGSQDRTDRRVQARIVANLGTRCCYVADADDGRPGFVQYLFTSADNELFQASYSHTGPPLATDEAMVEFLYVAPAARTMPFVTECMLLVVEEARQRGARSVVTFPSANNRGALMASHLVGFRPYAVRRSTYRFFRKSTTYEPRVVPMSELL